ncbi:unnamed protein product, partial [Coregonus sp. 'balchen']
IGPEGAGYQQAIKALLALKSRSDYEHTLEIAVRRHGQERTICAKQLGYPIIRNYNCSKSFIAVKALVGWKKVGVDKLVYLLYQLQSNALRDMLWGYCNLGNIHFTP